MKRQIVLIERGETDKKEEETVLGEGKKEKTP